MAPTCQVSYIPCTGLANIHNGNNNKNHQNVFHRTKVEQRRGLVLLCMNLAEYRNLIASLYLYQLRITIYLFFLFFAACYASDRPR